MNGLPYIAHCVASRNRTGGTLPATKASDSLNDRVQDAVDNRRKKR